MLIKENIMLCLILPFFFYVLCVSASFWVKLEVCVCACQQTFALQWNSEPLPVPGCKWLLIRKTAERLKCLIEMLTMRLTFTRGYSSLQTANFIQEINRSQVRFIKAVIRFIWLVFTHHHGCQNAALRRVTDLSSFYVLLSALLTHLSVIWHFQFRQ